MDPAYDIASMLVVKSSLVCSYSTMIYNLTVSMKKPKNMDGPLLQ